jgi:hypothetical protein
VVKWIGNGLISTANIVGVAFFAQDEALGVRESGYRQAMHRERGWWSSQVAYEQAPAIAQGAGRWQSVR